MTYYPKNADAASLIAGGMALDDALAEVGLSRDRYRPPHRASHDYLPSPDQIAAECEEIRRRSPRPMVGECGGPWSAPELAIDVPPPDESVA